MSHLIFPHNLSLETHLEDDCLLILVSSPQLIDPETIVTFIAQGIASLKMPTLKIVRIFGHEDGNNAPIWIREINLHQKKIESKTPFYTKPLQPKLNWLIISLPLYLGIMGGLYGLMQIFFFKNNGLLENFSINFDFSSTSILTQHTPEIDLENALNEGKKAFQLGKIAITEDDWNRVESQWKKAISTLALIPENTPEYDIAQKKIEEYKKNLIQAEKQPEYYREGINEATKAVQLGEVANSQGEWKEVQNQWGKAINLLQKVSPQDIHYLEAQIKLKRYEQYYSQVHKKVETSGMKLIKTITGNISPKSIVYSGKDLFFAQNMMYRHHITVYDRNYNLVKTISDGVKLADYGYQEYSGNYQGSPVEATFSHNGEYAWVSNYQMYGQEFQNPGSDRCPISSNYDPSFLYRINTNNLEIDQVIKVGSVPKFVATSPDNNFVLTSNWCSGDLSIINTQTNQEIQRIFLGAYPRGITIDKNSEKAYIAVMGSRDIAVVNLKDFSVSWLENVGLSPRHLVLDNNNEYLYASLNGDGNVARIHLETKDIVKINTGNAPRSMTLSKTGKYLYVVNYKSNSISKINTLDMKVVQTVNTPPHPIGITYDPVKKEVWVACYSGNILIFKDEE